MNAKTYVIAVVAIALVAVAVAFAMGLGPASGGDDVDEFPTATPTTTDGGAGGTTTAGDGTTATGTATATATATPEPAPAFDSEVERVEKCGDTCRDVTATITNEGDATATDVTVYTRIYAGNGTDGDVVWEGKREVGTLESGASVTETQRVELSYFDAVKVQQADGWITVKTTIESDEKTVTGTERRNVG